MLRLHYIGSLLYLSTFTLSITTKQSNAGDNAPPYASHMKDTLKGGRVHPLVRLRSCVENSPMTLKPQDLRGNVLNAIDLYHVARWEQVIDADLARMRDYEPDHPCSTDGIFSVFLPSTPQAHDELGYPTFNIRYISELIRRYINAGWAKVEHRTKTRPDIESIDGEAWTGHWLVLISPDSLMLKPAAETRPPKNPRRGFVYLFKANGLYKIGRSKDPEKRMRKMASAIMPFQIEKVHSIGCKDAHASEREFHKRFAPKRRMGEWFELTDEDVQAIMSITAM
jgi:hypothetical protein